MDDQRITKGFLAKLTLDTLRALRDRLEGDISLSQDPEEMMCRIEDMKLVEGVIAVREFQCSPK